MKKSKINKKKIENKTIINIQVKPGMNYDVNLSINFVLLLSQQITQQEYFCHCFMY